VPEPILTATTTMLCPHGAAVQVVPSSDRLLIEGQPALTVLDTFVIAACPNVDANGNPMPCLTVQWTVPSPTVSINGIAGLTSSSVGLCMATAGVPQGPVTIAATQERVLG
jgi:hypothetical protein